METDPVRDTTLDGLTQQAIDSLKIETLPGSNVISIIYSFPDPQPRAPRLSPRCCKTTWSAVRRCNRSTCRRASTKPRRHLYQVRLDGLEGNRQALLESVGASDPKEEITFRLNAINTEEQALNLYRDRLLQSQRWLEYLKTSLAAASNNKLNDYTFPYTFTTTVDNVAFEDREIKQMGER
jgi:hypothetical protein